MAHPFTVLRQEIIPNLASYDLDGDGSTKLTAPQYAALIQMVKATWPKSYGALKVEALVGSMGINDVPKQNVAYFESTTGYVFVMSTDGSCQLMDPAKNTIP